MQILAHRGWWTCATERNTKQAIMRALHGGFGIETDLRLHGGALVASHDHPVGGEMPLLELAGIVAGCPTAPPLALNVKEDGLQGWIEELLGALPAGSAFLFDMSVPDTIVSLRAGLPCWTRHSDIEPTPVLYDRVDGVWIDGFETAWWDEATIEGHLAAGKRVCLVSPELHGRPHEAAWARWAEWSVMDRDDVMVCTDHPDALREALT